HFLPPSLSIPPALPLPISPSVLPFSAHSQRPHTASSPLILSLPSLRLSAPTCGYSLHFPPSTPTFTQLPYPPISPGKATPPFSPPPSSPPPPFPPASAHAHITATALHPACPHPPPWAPSQNPVL
ncbi:unnamed protein product, partial [Closterium sp. Naga37s-1]